MATSPATRWLEEIEALHHHFEQYFLGAVDSLERLEEALAPEFGFVAPTGQERTRSEVVEMVRLAHGHTRDLAITVTDAELVWSTPELVIARYVENHYLADRSNHRLSTVVFRIHDGAPLGLQWLRVHETWIE